MENYIQFIVNGIIAGSLYALVAAGFSIIYNTNKFIHFAHGGVVILGGYYFYTLSEQLHFSFSVATIISALLTGFSGLLFYRWIYNPLKLKNASNIILLLAGIAGLIVLQNTIQLIYGARVRIINVTDYNLTYNIFGAIITKIQINILIVCFALFIFLYLLMSKSQLGRNMRAIANNDQLAMVIGINTNRIKHISFFLGSLIAGIGGSLIALDQSLSPHKGSYFMLKGFTGAVIGGLEYVPASILGSYFLGLIENLVIIYLPSEQKLLVTFVLLFIFLIFRPQGFLGFSSGGSK